MKMYELDNKGISRTIKEFNKTTYGKITFILSYAIFIFFLFLTIMSCIYLCIYGDVLVANNVALILVIVSLISFVLGSRNYYKELRIFVNKK